MLPVCLPFKNYLITSRGTLYMGRYYHLDYVNDVPRYLIDEEKEITRISPLPVAACDGVTKVMTVNTTDLLAARSMCSTGCGFYSGSPTMVHEHTGHWSIMAIAQGGSECPDPLRSKPFLLPPRHTLIRPYVPWITTTIQGTPERTFDNSDPFGFMMLRTGLSNNDWSGRWWMGGYRCFDRGMASDDMFRFYHEDFSITPHHEYLSTLTYYLEITCAHQAIIECVKIGLPVAYEHPRIWDIGTNEIKVRIPTLTFNTTYIMQVDAWAKNFTEYSGPFSPETIEDE